MKNNRNGAFSLTSAAVTAAAYAALTLAFAPVSYGVLQFRVSELLCILPFFMPSTVPGLFVGCAVANIFSGNVLDIVFGSLATLAAAAITSFIGKRGKTLGLMAAGCTVPVVMNALIVGPVITKGYLGIALRGNVGVYLLNCLQVAAGEAVVMFAGGLPLMIYLSGKPFFQRILEKDKKEEN